MIAKLATLSSIVALLQFRSAAANNQENLNVNLCFLHLLYLIVIFTIRILAAIRGRVCGGPGSAGHPGDGPRGGGGGEGGVAAAGGPEAGGQPAAAAAQPRPAGQAASAPGVPPPVRHRQAAQCQDIRGRQEGDTGLCFEQK